MFNLNRKVLFGVSVSMVLAMAVGSFALGETQTPASPRAVEAQSAVGATAGPFTVDGGTQGTDFEYTSPVLTIHSGDLTISTSAETNERIVVDGAVTITLEGVNINTSTGSALQIKDNAAFDVNILLADGYTNILTTTSDDDAGLRKADGGNTLTIGVPIGSQGDGILNVTGGYGGAGIGSESFADVTGITITGGKVIAKGGEYAAGIGGGYQGSGSNITISGGVVEAYAGKGDDLTIDPAGIGAGYHGSAASGNSITGDNVVVIAESGGTDKAALEGFGTTIDKGLIFTRQGSSGSWSGNMYNNITLSESLKIPGDLTIPEGKTLLINEGKTLTVPDGSVLTNEGTLTIKGNIDLSQGGEITTKTDFYRNGSTEVYKTGYQTYQTKAGVQKYKDLPNPDDTTLLKNSLNSDKFIYWYYLDKDGKEVAIKDGDAGDNVLPNQHKFYEKREEAYTISTSKEGEGSITPNATEVYEGDEVTFTVTPADGYELKEGSVSVKAGDKDVEFTEEDGKYTFTMPDSAVTISAVFEQSPEPTPTPPGPEPQPTPPGPQPGPEPTPGPTPDPSVNPDGDGSGSSSKTSDPFMGGIALALLGVATTGAVLVRKRK